MEYRVPGNNPLSAIKLLKHYSGYIKGYLILIMQRQLVRNAAKLKTINSNSYLDIAHLKIYLYLLPCQNKQISFH